jgi:hypothetical protein
MNGLAASSRKRVYAVGGRYSTDGVPLGSVVLRFNGRKWSRMPVRTPGKGAYPLDAVTATGRSAWASGGQYIFGELHKPVIAHRVGKVWRIQKTLGKGDQLYGADGIAGQQITASSRTRAFAGGCHQASGGGARTLLERYDGQRWTTARSRFS